MKTNCLRMSATLASALMAALGLAQGASGAMITGLFNTGVDDNGQVLPLHSVDQHYGLSGAASTAFVIPPVSTYVAAPAGSAWIGPNATDSNYPSDPLGLYNYILRINVDLTHYDPSRAQISGLWATDNSSQIWLNGVYTGFSTGDVGFAGLSPFLIQNTVYYEYFKPGNNVLEFRVFNSTSATPFPNPSGLLVANLRGVDDGSLVIPPVPEPSTVLAGALLLLPFAARTIRRFR